MRQSTPVAHPYFAGAPSPMAISHAGDSDTGEHNGSRAAYRLAYDHGFRWFQVDVVSIGGGQLASCHALLGRRRAWEQLSIDEVSAAAGYEVPLLADLLDEFTDVKFNIEVKSRRVEPALRRLLEQPGVIDRVCVSTPFHHGMSRRFRRDFGDRICLAAPLIDGGLAGLAMVPGSHIRHDVYQVWLTLAWSRRIVKRAINRGTRFQVWTANTPTHLERCLRLGVTGIITDRHALLRRHLIESGRWVT